jgi:3-hydroxyacyl-CoA dehydrogenase
MVWSVGIRSGRWRQPSDNACMLLAQGVGSAEDIDRGMKLGTNQPMGPLQLADFIGMLTQLCDSASFNVSEPHWPFLQWK